MAKKRIPVWFVKKSANWTNINDITRQLRREQLLNISSNLKTTNFCLNIKFF